MLERAFFEWLREGGAQLHGIEAAYVEEGWRGVVATTDIDPGDLFLGFEMQNCRGSIDHWHFSSQRGIQLWVDSM